MKNVYVLLALGVIVAGANLNAASLLIPSAGKSVTINCSYSNVPNPSDTLNFLNNLGPAINNIVNPLPANTKNVPEVQKPILAYAAVVQCLQTKNACGPNRNCNNVLNNIVLNNLQNTLPAYIVQGTPIYKAPQSITVSDGTLPNLATTQVELASVTAAAGAAQAEAVKKGKEAHGKHKKGAKKELIAPTPSPAGNVTVLQIPSNVTFN